MQLPKKVSERYGRSIPKFQKILQLAHDRDVNEADTVLIVQDILSEVFGFEKYVEITSEYAVRGTFCDLAISTGQQLQFFIEVKSIGTTLRDNHVRQLTDYCCNKGVQWAVLTNGIVWQVYKVKFEKPIDCDLVVSIDFLSLAARKSEDQERIFLLTKEGLVKAARDHYYERSQCVNRFTVAAVIASEPFVGLIRRQLRKISGAVKIDLAEIQNIVRHEVLKREVIEGESALKAQAKLKRRTKKPIDDEAVELAKPTPESTAATGGEALDKPK